VSAKMIGIQIHCDGLKRVVNISRPDFAIGPLSAKKRHYIIRCHCGSLHKIPTQSVTRPTKTKPARVKEPANE
jgi:hypothetical protein